ncbi:hypothetical protein EDC94DRAFT_620546 [Helicostylum pulchrum]|nr:hypothetical protein EDC94DRAFT_620546 [Helicostylum pulchrum]
MKLGIKAQTGFSNTDKIAYQHYYGVSRSKSIRKPSKIPIPSPVFKSKRKYYLKKGRSIIYLLPDEIKQSLKQCSITELRYKRLDQTMQTTLFMQTKTYERNINYLNAKIKKLEQDHQPVVDNDQSYYSDFVDDLLAYYTYDDVIPEETHNEIEQFRTKVIECEQTTHHLISHYIVQLEAERFKIQKLNTIIQEQKEIILTLENQAEENIPTKSLPTSNSNDELLNVLVDLQSVELIEKKKILTELTEERKELLKKIEVLSKRQTTHSLLTARRQIDRSSIDMLAQMTSRSDFKRQSKHMRPISPPLTPPPKNPIPPTPRYRTRQKQSIIDISTLAPDSQSCNSSISSFTKKFSTSSLLKSWKRSTAS